MPLPTVYNQSSATPYSPYTNMSTAPNTSTPSGPVYTPPPSPNYVLGSNPGAITLPKTTSTGSTTGTTSGLLSSGQYAGYTSTQATTAAHNAALMAQYGPGNYTIDASGNVLPKSSPTISSPTPQTGSTPNNPSTYSQAALNAPTGGIATPYTPPSNQTTFPGLLGNLAQTSSNQSPVAASAANQLLNKSQGPSPEYQAATAEANKYNQALEQSRVNEAKGLAANAGNPIPLEFQQGRGQILQSQYGQEQAALGSAYGAAATQQNAANQQQSLQLTGLNEAGGIGNTAQGLQQQGLTSAAGLAQPVGQFGLLTNPQTGAPLNTQVFQSAIQQAQQLVKSGTPVNDPSVQALLSPFGFVGPLAFNQAMQAQGGGWNPAAQSATAGQNISQGTQTQGEAYALNLGLQQLKTIQPVIQNFLQTAGINPTDVPAMNSQISTYIANLKNPAASTQYQYMLNDLQKFASQMLAAGAGGTPTGTQAATDLMNPQNLSMNQIQYALNTLDTLGTNQVSVLQQQSAASLGGNTGYAGNPATTSTSTPVAPMNPAAAGIKSNPVVEAGVGSLMNIFSELTSLPSLIGGLLGHIFS